MAFKLERILGAGRDKTAQRVSGGKKGKKEKKKAQQWRVC